MGDTIKTLKTFVPYLGCGIAACAVVWIVYKRRKPRVCGVDYPRDKVIVHQICMGKYVPSIGHFVVKLETYLRMTNIPYEPNYNSIAGPKCKIPWIEYNGETVADSQFIIEFLNLEFNKDLDAHLTDKEKAMAWAVQRWLEESTYWFSVSLRMYHYASEMLATKTDFGNMPGFIQAVIDKGSYYQGVGRYTLDELERMMKRDLDTLSVLLGEKKYLMGYDKPTTFDCAVFGQLAQVKYAMPDCCLSARHFAQLTNLNAYVERIKGEYWPDWDERTSAGKSNVKRRI